MTMKITYATVLAGSDDIDRHARELEQKLLDLGQRVSNTIAHWSGEASATYNAKQKGWEQDVHGLVRTLGQIRVALVESKDGYQATDKKAASQFDF